MKIKYYIVIFLFLSCTPDGILNNHQKLKEVELYFNGVPISGESWSATRAPDYNKLVLHFNFIDPNDQKPYNLTIDYLENKIGAKKIYIPYSNIFTTKEREQKFPYASMLNFYEENDASSSSYRLDTFFQNFIEISKLGWRNVEGFGQFKFIRADGSFGPDTVTITNFNFDILKYKGT